MCANCVAQGAVYVGGALGALRVMGARARARRLAERPAADPADDTAVPSASGAGAETRDGLKAGQPG